MSGPAACLALLVSTSAGAEEREPLRVEAQSSTYFRYFQRALLPGPIGSEVVTDTVAPVYEYLTVRAQGVPLPIGTDGARVEASGWYRGLVGDVAGERRVDGDVTALTLLVPFGPLYARVGRQAVASPAARFFRIDGAQAGASAGVVRVDAYGGYVSPARAGSWATGGRVEVGHPSWGRAGASVHEARRSSELYARTLAADALVTALDVLTLDGVATVDVSMPELAEARADIALRPVRPVDVTLAYRHADPMLLIPRDSVLGVFDTSHVNETGAEVVARPLERISFDVSGFAGFWTDGDTGLRLSARMLADADPGRRVHVVLGYGRVVEPKSGYHAARVALSYRFAGSAYATVEHQTLFYDALIRGVRTSAVEEASVTWRFAPAFSALLGGTLTRSPYASSDVQALLRLVYEQELVP
jgi:hypothetical protein